MSHLLIVSLVNLRTEYKNFSHGCTADLKYQETQEAPLAVSPLHIA